MNPKAKVRISPVDDGCGFRHGRPRTRSHPSFPLCQLLRYSRRRKGHLSCLNEYLVGPSRQRKRTATPAVVRQGSVDVIPHADPVVGRVESFGQQRVAVKENREPITVFKHIDNIQQERRRAGVGEGSNQKIQVGPDLNQLSGKVSGSTKSLRS